MRRKPLLMVLLVVLLLIPQLLSFIAPNDNLEGWSLRPLDGVVLVAMVFLFVGGLRGSLSSLTSLAVFAALVGVGSLIASLFVPNGPAQLAAAGLSSIGVAIVLLLIRLEVAEASTSHAEDPVQLARPTGR